VRRRERRRITVEQSKRVPKEVVRSVALIEDVLDRVNPTDWHDEWKSRIEEVEEMRDCLETVGKTLREMPGWAHERRAS
jgi:hypothetical protein